MKSVTLRLPDELVDQVAAEAKRRKMSKSDVLRERLNRSADSPVKTDWSDVLAKVVGAVDGLPHGDSRNIKAALRASGYGRKRPR
jgi:Arc/MetJ-type ribon-helix-helix transcriptional regulator